ncbi:MAG: glycosyltransferase family 4 protein [Saprospiraceae bacterium]|nr:glycosyltransferase family 4 protein [Saprospiraceae bacterium]
MKILLCIGSYKTRVSGPAVVAEQFFSINESHSEHECHILTNDVDKSTDKVHKIDINYPRKLGAFDFLICQFFYYRAIIVLQKQFNFDIIVFGNVQNSLLSRLLLLRSIKIIGIINDYLTANARLSMHVTRRRYWFFKYFVRFFEYVATHLVDMVIVCSDDLRQRIITAYGIKSEKIKTLPLGFDVQNIPFRKNDQPFKSPIKLLFIKSNLVSGGMDILTTALTILTEYSFILTVIGAPDFRKAEIEHLIEKYPDIHLRFLGFQSQNTVYQEMQNNDILCTPSRVESLGIANAEGLANGISVVSTREGGITEVLDYGKNGWLAEPENAKDLVDKLKECIEADPSLRAEKSQYGRLFVEQKFDYKQFNDLFLKTCSALLK